MNLSFDVTAVCPVRDGSRFLTLTLFVIDYKKRVKKMEESYNEEQDQNGR